MRLPKVPAFRKKKQEKANQEFRNRAEDFKLEYMELSKKHRCDFDAFLRASDKSIVADIRIIDISGSLIEKVENKESKNINERDKDK